MSIVERAAEKLRESKDNEPAHARDEHPPARQSPPSPVSEHGPPSTPRTEGGGTTRGVQPAFSVELDALTGTQLVPPDWQKDTLAEEYRRIKRPLLANISGSGVPAVASGRRIMVTSALVGEGKSFTTFNLARSLAQERDYSVLLIDADVAKSTISKALGMWDRKGLIDILSDDSVSPESVIAETDEPGLSVLPAGSRHGTMAELLSSRRMQWLMSKLDKDPARIILLDSVPLLSASEAQACALSMGQIVMVVKAGETEQKAVQSALALLDPSKAINLLLNQSRRAHGDAYAAYYGSYYGDSLEHEAA